MVDVLSPLKLDAAGLEALRGKYEKIAEVEFNKHQLIFRKCTRQEVREYRRKMDSPAEKPDAVDQLAQQILVAFDGELDLLKARVLFNALLEKNAALTDLNRFGAALGSCLGVMDEETEAALGKFVTVRSSPLRSMPAA